MKTILLCISGEKIPVLFDGTRVTSPDFPDIEMEFFAHCGQRISQQMLVDICKTKVNQQ